MVCNGLAGRKILKSEARNKERTYRGLGGSKKRGGQTRGQGTPEMSKKREAGERGAS